ncbi:Na(+)/citrate cotransporter-like [Dermacentor andersoni]|uniref:Na(+)/citrate cotransporter-like n=1 Tax=Dermacentor andersoni TaxID=34620 RepID=UPI002417CE1C|nr:Na(+)/citrate cotransporter-like [Dermacentor andersoni]
MTSSPFPWHAERLQRFYGGSLYAAAFFFRSSFRCRWNGAGRRTPSKTAGSSSASSGTPQPPSERISLAASAPSSVRMYSDVSSHVAAVRSVPSTDQGLPQQQQQASTSKTPAGSIVEKFKQRGTVHMNVNLNSVPGPLQAGNRAALVPTPTSRMASVDAVSPLDADLRKAAMRDRKISIYERGKKLRPGEDDLSAAASAIEPRKQLRKKSSIFGGIREFIKRRFTTSTYVDSSYLQERIAWEKERYTAIQKDLLIGIALTASVGSITSFHGNDSNIVLGKYYANNGDRKDLTTIRWLLVTLPVAASAVAFAWSLLLTGYLERYDADEDEDARYAISHVLKHKYYEISSFSLRDIVILLFTLAWCASKIAYAHEETLTEDRVLHAPTSLLLGETLFVALFSLPGELQFWRDASNDASASGSGRLASWSRLASSMPWGVLIVYGCVHSMLIASRVSGFSALASNVILRMNDLDPVTNQLILTCVAALLTEVVSSTTTASMLVPLAITLAKESNAHPLYLAIPVTVASSTSLLTPVASTAITVVVSYAEISIADLLIPGLMIKAFVVTSVLLSVNTIGEYVFNFDDIAYPYVTARVNYSLV